MLLGAIVDAGVPLESIESELAKLGVGGYRLTRSPGSRGGVSGTQVSVEEVGGDPRRYGWRDFLRIAGESSLPATVVERAGAVFRRLAEAEAAAHRTGVEQVTLHELGSVDTLVDVVGAVVGLDALGVDRLYSSPFPSGSGVRRGAHGPIPMPAPATAALFAIAGAPVVPPPGGIVDAGEMVTPTGAAILTTLATFRQPVLNLERTGYGLGSRDPEGYPNVVALWLGLEAGAGYTSGLTLVETNIDDMSPELLGYAQERLFTLGARDVWFTAIQMKKSRPATMMSAIVPSGLERAAVDLVLEETSTLGVRVRPVTRYEAERETVETETSLGVVQVKIKRLEGRAVGVSPEYEACRRIALERRMPIQDVYRTVQREAEDRLMGS